RCRSTGATCASCASSNARSSPGRTWRPCTCPARRREAAARGGRESARRSARRGRCGPAGARRSARCPGCTARRSRTTSAARRGGGAAAGADVGARAGSLPTQARRTTRRRTTTTTTTMTTKSASRARRPTTAATRRTARPGPTRARPAAASPRRASKGECRNGARVRKSHRVPVWGKKTESAAKAGVKADRSPHCASHEGSGEEWTNHGKRGRPTSGLKRPFNFMANFPSPPSLIVGNDGDLSPAYSLSSFRNKQLPHCSHPVWTWQLGACVVPPPLSLRGWDYNLVPT
uniref:Uncharacterized protein n=1 Tax=Pygocentrus nattereri TaxID=42514 RepID=A0AAR2IHG6_PYGNA